MALGLGIVLSLFGLGALCALLFRLTAYALPVYAAVATGLYAHNSGAGPLSAIALAILAGTAVVTVGQLAFSVRALPIRIVTAVLFAIPAAVAGYSVVHGLSGVGAASETWRQIFGFIGAAIAGATALARLALPGRAGARPPQSIAEARSPFDMGEYIGRAPRSPSFEPEGADSGGLSRPRRTPEGHVTRRGAAWR
jgi:hypothetical protein